jgi:two-component system osmolarity sensor histidine kinase EnvZ
VKLLSPPGLFWRTYLLILLLLAASSAAWLQSFRLFEREPRAQQLAEQLVSIVNITRSALLYSDPIVRLALLADLADSQGIRIAPLEQSDVVRPFPDDPVADRARARVLQALGPGTRLASEVNGVGGIWVSFAIDADEYWVVIDRDPLARAIGTAWIRWAAIAALASLLAAVAITRVVNRPLARLSQSALALGSGRIPEPLPERGPPEIATVNASFNRMVSDLAQAERDRAVLLAGISHDLRTPLTRLRLEVELGDLPAESRANMVADLEQMDQIVAQFLDYARSDTARPTGDIDLSALVAQTLAASRLPQDETAGIELHIDDGIHVDGLAVELSRAIANLLANADRYGRDPATGRLQLSVRLRSDARGAVLAIADRGPGIPAADVDALLRPFVRGDAARSGVKGAGLGLAIVARVARLHGAKLALGGNEPSGLRVTMHFPPRRGQEARPPSAG